jgi:hypothetical protein
VRGPVLWQDSPVRHGYHCLPCADVGLVTGASRANVAAEKRAKDMEQRESSLQSRVELLATQEHGIAELERSLGSQVLSLDFLCDGYGCGNALNLTVLEHTMPSTAFHGQAPLSTPACRAGG